VIVVSNSSPLMNLAVVGQVHLLEWLYGKVYIPEAVWQERSGMGTGQPWAAVMPTLAWLESRSVSHRSIIPTITPSVRLSRIRRRAARDVSGELPSLRVRLHPQPLDLLVQRIPGARHPRVFQVPLLSGEVRLRRGREHAPGGHHPLRRWTAWVPGGAKGLLFLGSPAVRRSSLLSRGLTPPSRCSFACLEKGPSAFGCQTP
jgi:hypothetical protein